MSFSVHDNHLVSYEVDAVTKQIVFHTEYAYGEQPFEKTDIVFKNVLDHHFRYPVLPSIIFGVEEVAIQNILIRDDEIINEGHKMGGWPSFWSHSTEAMVEAIEKSGCKMYELTSSYGMEGWVVAAHCEFKKINKGKDSRTSIATSAQG